MAQIPKPFQVPLITQFKNRSASVAKDAKVLNGFGEGMTLEAFQMRKKYGTLPIETLSVIKRPGYGAGTLYEAGGTQGITSYLGVTMAVINNKFFTSSSTSIAISSGGLPVDFE